MDESDYQTFFEEHSKEFRAADSLQLGGAYFFIANDTIAIDSTMVYEYYRDNLDSFYLDKSVAFDYIAVDKRQTINRIRNYLLYDVDFDLLKYCYSNELEIANIQYHQQKDLPVIIEENLNVIDKGEISQPIEFENQWVILRKIDTKSEGVQNFEDVKDDIGAMLWENVAREIVYQNAKTAFDSTSYFSQIRSYADSSAVFKTEFQDIKEPFEILGDLSKYGQEFLRFWRNEKYSSIINLPDDKGYAVIYILRKKPSKAMTFDEALPQLKKIFTSRKSFDTAEAYVKGLRERILDGEDPNELLYFLGGWQQEENLDFNSKIFGKEWSRLILEDIASHEEGYFSPILSLSEKQLLFYQINRLKKIPRDQFLAEKDQFKQELLDKRYQQWLNQFRNTIGVENSNY